MYRRLEQSGALAVGIRAVTSRWERIPSLARAFILPVTVIAAAIAGLFVRIPVHWLALSDPKEAATFVAQAWAVTGASLGFAVVLIVFAFQAVASARPSASIRELAMATPLLLVLYLGVAALLVDGLVLLGAGYQAPSKWAASWATDVSGSAIFLLAFLIAASVRAVDPQVLQRRRIIQVRKRAGAAISAEAMQRLAVNLLIHDGDQFGYEVSPLASVGSPRSDTESVYSTRTGIIVDVRLDRLRHVARKYPDRKITVIATPGRAVSKGARLAFLPAEHDVSSRRVLRAAFKIRRKTVSDANSLLVAAADELHQDAIQAIGSGRAMAFQEVCQAQEELLLAFPEVWARLGQTFTADFASGLFPLALGPLDTLGTHLYTQAIRAIDHRDREIASSAVGLPLTVATRALEFNAHGLSDRMLSVLSGIASSTAPSPPASLGRQMHMESLSHVTSYVTFVVFPKIENVELAETDRREAIKFLSEAVVALAGMMKDAIEQGDVEFLDKASKEWRRFGEFWLEGYEYRTNSNDLEYQLASATRDILDKFLFVLCAWQLRRLWTDPTDEAALHAFTALASFTNIQRLFDLVISQYRDSGSGLLSNWILGALPQGEVHMIDVDTWMIRALVLIAIRLAPSPGLNLLPCTAPKCREEA